MLSPRIPPAPDALDVLVRALSALARPLDIILTIAPVSLTPVEHRWLACAAARLDVPRVVGDEVRARLLASLEGWVRAPRGHRVTCRLVCQHGPAEAAWLDIVRDALFPGVEVDVEDYSAAPPTDTSAACADPDALDLRGCFSESAPWPALLPSATTLLEAGVPAWHVERCQELPGAGVRLGWVQEQAGCRPVRIAHLDRDRHLYVCGATGTGKSTLLFNLIRQDIDNGEGVCLIDPHGDLFQQVLAAIPAQRAGDVIVIDPTDPAAAVGINLLQCDGPRREIRMAFVSNELVKIFDRLYDLRVTGGPIFEHYVRNAVLLAMANTSRPATLLDVPRIFEDADFRRFLARRCQDPMVQSFWTHQAERAGGECSLANIAPYVTSKLNQFTTNALLRPIVGRSRSTIDLRAAMDDGRIVLVNLATGLLGELDTQLLGMLIVGKLYAAAMERAGQPPSRRRGFLAYIDEFQYFTTDTVAHMLAGARKFGLSLTLATQTLSQLRGRTGQCDVLDAVLGNCGTMVFFRLGPPDAERLAVYMRPELSGRDLQDLPDFHAAVRLLAHHAPARPFVLRTDAANMAGAAADPQALVEHSRRRDARPRTEVERSILERYTSQRDSTSTRSFEKGKDDGDDGQPRSEVQVAAQADSACRC